MFEILRGCFEISVFEILRVNCASLESIPINLTLLLFGET